jgi:hypothetical protein
MGRCQINAFGEFFDLNRDGQFHIAIISGMGTPGVKILAADELGLGTEGQRADRVIRRLHTYRLIKRERLQTPRRGAHGPQPGRSGREIHFSDKPFHDHWPGKRGVN